MDAAEIEAVIHEGVPLAALWRVQVLRAEAGEARVRLPFDKLLLRPGGTVSGPALMGLADIAFWAAALSETAGRDRSVTASMGITFLRQAGSGAVIAEARLVKRGRRLIYGEVWMRGEGSDEACAHATASWASIGDPG